MAGTWPTGASWLGDLNVRSQAPPEAQRDVELPSWAYMPSVLAMGIDTPYGPSAMWPPREAPTPLHPGTTRPSPEDLPLFSNSGLVDITQPSGRVAMWFAGRDSWMQSETHRRDDSSVQSRLDNTQQRRIDEFHNI